MIPLADLFVFGAVVALVLDLTVDRIDNCISQMHPEGMAENQPPARMVEVHDFPTLPLQR